MIKGFSAKYFAESKNIFAFGVSRRVRKVYKECVLKAQIDARKEEDGLPISLKAARVDAGLTQRTAASALKITRATLASYEKYRTVPDIAMGRRIARLYGRPIDDIIFLREDCAKSTD